MGSAVSSVSGFLGNITSSTLNPVASSLGSTAGGALGGIAQGIVSAIPDVPIADQSAVQNQINTAQQMGATNQAQSQAQMAMSGQSLAQTQQGIQASQGAINNAQGAVGNAQQVNQGLGSNVNNAIGLVGQTAAGVGAAQQAASAQLQAGTNQAINTQQAMANSGNLSQMIGGQRTAMQDAATIQQQNSLNAAQLQAQMAGTAQSAYTGASAQQAAQAGTNASLQQNQTAAQQAQAAQQAGLYNSQLGMSQSLAADAAQNQANALTGQENALGIQQQALGQTGQNKALAVSGVLNAAGGAGTAAALSDENTKTNIEYASGPRTGTTFTGTDASISDSMKPDPSQTPSMLSTQSQPQSGMNSQQKQQIINSIGSAFKMGQSPVPQYQMISSDKNGKKDIESKDKVKSFLDALDPVSFKYKQPDGQMGKTEGEHIGVIAQQVEKAPHGKSMIRETPQGKAIDMPSAVGTLLAAAADINDRMSTLEEYFKARKSKEKK